MTETTCDTTSTGSGNVTPIGIKAEGEPTRMKDEVKPTGIVRNRIELDYRERTATVSLTAQELEAVADHYEGLKDHVISMLDDGREVFPFQMAAHFAEREGYFRGVALGLTDIDTFVGQGA